MSDRIVLPGDGEEGAADSDPTIVIEPTVREIEDTTLADRDAPSRQIRQQIAEGSEDWGEGFYVEPEPVLVTRNPDGSIARTTPLSQIPGVHFQGGQMKDELITPQQQEELTKTVEAKPTPVPLQRADREKLRHILTTRLFKYYKDRGPKDPRYNPFRDGIPVKPATTGDREHLQPLPGTELYPATGQEIYDYLMTIVAERAKIVDTKRFGGGTLQDLSLRIE